LGQLEGKYILASESCAFDLIRATFIREVEPGEIVIIKDEKIESYHLPKKDTGKKAHCIFENIYFARPDSHIFDDNVYQVRKRLGVQLAKEYPVRDADFVMPIPDSGVYAALGYSYELGLPFEVGMVVGDEEKVRLNWGIRSLPWLILADKDRIERARAYTMLGNTVADAYAALMPKYGFRNLIGMLKTACDKGVDLARASFVSHKEPVDAVDAVQIPERGRLAAGGARPGPKGDGDVETFLSA